MKKLYVTIHQAAPTDRFVVAGLVRSRLEDRLANTQRDKLPVDEHRVPLEQEDKADLVHRDGHHLDSRDEVADRVVESLRLGAQFGEFLCGRRDLLGPGHGDQYRDEDAHRAEPEAGEGPVGHASRGGAGDYLLEHEQRQIRQHGAGAGEQALSQEAASKLGFGQPVGD